MYYPEHEMAKLRVEELIKAREIDRLTRKPRQARSPSMDKGIGVRVVAFVTMLFRI